MARPYRRSVAAPRWGSAGSAEVAQQRHQGAHPVAGAALGLDGGLAVAERRAGDVDVGPRDALADELLQEEGGDGGAAVAAGADVLHVGDVGVQLGPPLVG